MARITLDLLRKRCEHNEGLIYNLEELSLHQDNLEEIENLDKWCKDLKILYLQGNSIQKIENLSRLKNLEYLNLALNGIERIENLEGCESLRKLDLTANFIGDVTSVESLRANPYLEELYLTGNPCADFDVYRSYVVGALPHLRSLDGQEITRTEQLQAIHHFLDMKARIIQQQVAYKLKRDIEKQDNAAKLSNAAQGDCSQEWENLSWSPEYRRQMHRHRVDASKQTQDRTKSHKKKNALGPSEEKRHAVLYNSTGEIKNVNAARLEYFLNEEDENNEIVLDVSVYRHLDSSLVEVDVHPSYVKVTVKGKVLQVKLAQEVLPDKSTIQRSRTSGHLLIRMPLAEDYLKKSPRRSGSPRRSEITVSPPTIDQSSKLAVRMEKLEVDPSLRSNFQLNIAKTELRKRYGDGGKLGGKSTGIINWSESLARPNSPGFVDNLDVPPLI